MDIKNVHILLRGIAFVLLCLACSCSSGRGPYACFNPNDYHPTFQIGENCLSMVYEMKIEADSAVFRLKNVSDDTLYLFTSYIEDEYKFANFDIKRPTGAPYLHRYDPNTNRYKLSLLPIVPYVGFYRSDRIIVSDERVIRRGGVIYMFDSLSPGDYKDVSIALEDLTSDVYYEDFMKDMPSIVHLDLAEKLIRHEGKPEEIIWVEFALYRNIPYMKPVRARRTLEEATQSFYDFDILSIPVSLPIN